MTVRDPQGASASDAFGAVVACTRALGGSSVGETPELVVTWDVAALRAAGDRIAVRRRFHDLLCHTAHRPRDTVAARVFDALEAARLDVLGVRWLPGVAINLMRDPGPQPLLIRWVAFEIFADRRAPTTLADAVARLRKELPPVLLPGVIALRAVVEQQSNFAQAAAVWARAVAGHAWCTSALMRVEEAETPPARSLDAERDASSGIIGEASEEAAAARSRSPLPGSGVSVAHRTGAPRYVAYTTAYDRVVDASSLADPAELLRLRTRLESEFAETRLAVTRVANRLRRTLMARQVRHWQFDLDEGVIDGSRLAGLIASPRDVRPFKQETDNAFPAGAVTFLIDHSGSMRGRPILMAALTVEILVLALERCGVRCEVLGFTTREWNGGRPQHEWVANNQPASPGRLNALEHIVLKSADVPWRRARHGLGLVLRDDLLKENVDGEAVQWAHARLARRPERRRILIVVSDGEPRDEATERANGSTYLARHLRAVVEDIEDNSPIQVAAIGVGHDVLRFYSQATTIASIEDLGEALSGALVSFFTTGRRTPQSRHLRQTGWG